MMLYDANVNEQEALRALAALRNDRPEWIPVLQAALSVAERAAPYGGDFAGSWVLDELEKQSGHSTWLPNLRILVSYGFLEKAGESTRGGRRAYYRFTNEQTVRKVLSQVRPEVPSEPSNSSPRRFRFIGAGDSGEIGSGTGRNAGDIAYKPRSWR